MDVKEWIKGRPEEILSGLRGVGKTWFEENQDNFAELAEDELRDVVRALRSGDTREAKVALALRLSPEDWRAYRDGTTAKLEAIAVRRAELMDALEDLAARIARMLGKALTPPGLPL